jgi:hypothetical protein
MWNSFRVFVAAGISGLGQYQQAEAMRIEWLRNTELARQASEVVRRPVS